LPNTGPPDKTKKSLLSEQQVRAVAFIEQTFWEHGGLPTNEQIAERTGVQLGTITRYWQQPHFREALLKRGIDLSTDASRGILTIDQLNAANVMLNLMDKRSQREKLDSIGVNSQQYNAWLRQAAFQNYLRRRAEELFKASDSDAYLSLIDVVKGGDTNAIKLFFEMRGVYTPRAQLDVNIDMIMVRIVEIIAKHVQDPDIRARIADDIETLGMPTRALPSPPSFTPNGGPSLVEF
jgi:putative insertion element HTH domain-containing protein